MTPKTMSDRLMMVRSDPLCLLYVCNSLTVCALSSTATLP